MAEQGASRVRAGETGQGLGVLKWGDSDPQLWVIKPVVTAAFRSLCQAGPLVSWIVIREGRKGSLFSVSQPQFAKVQRVRQDSPEKESQWEIHTLYICMQCAKSL